MATSARSDRPALALSLLVWLVMLTAAIVLVAVNGRNVPCWDDWDLVPAMTGQQPVTAQWLWSQHNEHRVPVPRLLMLALLRLGPADFRAGMYYNVFAAAALALLMIFAARRARGYAAYSDVFFPVVLMHWGEAINYLWCWQVQFYTSMLLAGCALALIVRSATRPALPAAVGVGACVLLLPLCGANGLGMVPSLSLWLGYIAILRWRGGSISDRRTGLLLAGLAIAALLITGLYFVGYSRVPFHPSTHNPRRILLTAMQFLTSGFGPGVVGLGFPERVPVPFWPAIVFLVTLLFVITGFMLVRTWLRQPAERVRLTGLLLFLGAMVCLALGLGMGRNGFEPRYITLSVPALCAVYLAWSLYGKAPLQPAITAILLTTAVMLLPLNIWWGWRYTLDLRSRLDAFGRDIVAGTPPYQIIQRYSFLHPHHIVMMDYMPMLRQASVGVFAHLQNDPPFKEIKFPATPIDTTDVQWNNGIVRATGKAESLTFALPVDTDLAGLRLRYTYSHPKHTEPYIAIYWKSSVEPEWGENSYTKYSPTGDRANWRDGTWLRLGSRIQTMTARVCQPVRMVQIRPAIGNGELTIYELTALVAPKASSER